MAKTYRPYVPEQDLLLPPSLRDWLPEGHLAFFVSDLVDHAARFLRASAASGTRTGGATGRPRRARQQQDHSERSKHKAMSYGRMREKQRQLREEVKKLLAQAEAADAAQDAEYGSDRRGDELPADLQRREERRFRLSG